MKFDVERSLFATALAACTRIVERKSGIPILTHVLIKAEDSHVSIRATNLDMEASFRIPAEVHTDGAATLLAEMLDGFVQRVRSDVVSLDMIEPFKAALKSGKSRLTIPALDPKDFPSFEARDCSVTFAMMGDDLRSALEQCAFAIGDEQNNLTGVFVHLSKDGEDAAIRFASTNGPCFFMAQRPLPIGAERLERGFILPKAAAAEIVKLAVSDVEIGVTQGYARFAFANGAALATKLIDGEFPDYRRIIPVEAIDGSSVDRKALADAIDRVALTSDGKDRCVRIEFASGAMLLEKRDATRGHAIEELPADTKRDVAFGMSTMHLSKFLRAISSDQVDVFCGNPNAPVMMRPAGQTNPTCMIAPIRIVG